MDGDEGNDATKSRVMGYFHTRPVHINESHPMLDLDAIVNELNAAVDQFTCRGSGFVLNKITKLSIAFVPFCPLGGGNSYIETPDWLLKTNAVVNVKNYQSEDCFKWAIISAMFPATTNVDRISSYRRYKNAVECSGLNYPVQPNQTPVFEQNNPTIAIHCLAYDDEKDSFLIIHTSSEMHKRQHKITLLLLDSPDGNAGHYVWVKYLSRLIASKYTKKCAHFVCLSCLHLFASQRVLREHEPNCLAHAPQQCTYPAGKKCEIEIPKASLLIPFEFCLVADFESFLVPAQPSLVNTHVPSGFCIYRVTQHENYQTDPVTYSGDDVMGNFFEHVFAEAKTISKILSHNVSMKPLTCLQQAEIERATNCSNCNAAFLSQNEKTCHHSVACWKKIVISNVAVA